MIINKQASEYAGILCDYWYQRYEVLKKMINDYNMYLEEIINDKKTEEYVIDGQSLKGQLQYIQSLFAIPDLGEGDIYKELTDILFYTTGNPGVDILEEWVNDYEDINPNDESPREWLTEIGLL